MAKIRKQIISPHVRFATSSRGPYANRIGQGAYAKTFQQKGPPELNPDPNFDDPARWTTSGGFTVANGLATCDGTGPSFVNRDDIACEIGKTYTIIYEITRRDVGQVRFSFTGDGEGPWRTAVGVYEDEITVTAGWTGETGFRAPTTGPSAFDGDITSLSIKEKVD